MADQYVIVICGPGAHEVIGPFGSEDAANQQAVREQLVSWTVRPLFPPSADR